jgi:hypothetical protein
MQEFKQSLVKMPSVEEAGRGEGGGPRWWAGKWDETKSEHRMRGGLRASLTLNAGYQGDKCKEIPLVDSQESLPRIHVTWDGMVVHFDKADR